MIPEAKLTLATGEDVILEPQVLAVGWREGRRGKRHVSGRLSRMTSGASLVGAPLPLTGIGITDSPQSSHRQVLHVYPQTSVVPSCQPLSGSGLCTAVAPVSLSRKRYFYRQRKCTESRRGLEKQI